MNMQFKITFFAVLLISGNIFGMDVSPQPSPSLDGIIPDDLTYIIPSIKNLQVVDSDSDDDDDRIRGHQDHFPPPVPTTQQEATSVPPFKFRYTPKGNVRPSGSLPNSLHSTPLTSPHTQKAGSNYDNLANQDQSSEVISYLNPIGLLQSMIESLEGGDFDIMFATPEISNRTLIENLKVLPNTRACVVNRLTPAALELLTSGVKIYLLESTIQLRGFLGIIGDNGVQSETFEPRDNKNSTTDDMLTVIRGHQAGAIFEQLREYFTSSKELTQADFQTQTQALQQQTP